MPEETETNKKYCPMPPPSAYDDYTDCSTIGIARELRTRNDYIVTGEGR